MDREKNKEDQEKLSRREFVKDATLVIGGAALVSLTLSSACKNAGASVTTSTLKSTTAVSTEPSSTPPASSTAPTSTTPGTTPISSTATGTIPPVTFTSGVTLVPIQGCSTKVATDRLYSLDNIWVKSLGNNIVQIGITDTFQVLLGLVDTCWIYQPGATLKISESFGSIEGYKMSVDLVSPVSGKVLETNQAVIQHPAELLNGDPYITGWMLKVQISNPAELNKLVAHMYYAYLHSEGWTGPVPAMH